MTARVLEVVLEVKLGDEPIEGILHYPDGPTASFAGWLDLVRLLEAAVAGANRDADACSSVKHSISVEGT